VPRTPARDANRAAPAGDSPAGDPEGFTFVEMVIGLLLAGIFAAVVVFSVFTVTHPAPKPDPACTGEVAKTHLAIHAYELKYNKFPKDLQALVKAKILTSAPSPTSPSGAAGFTYNSDTGEYTGECPKH
jgi:prepilin-type N-terminal cleavage/methylation domain-containing protein